MPTRWYRNGVPHAKRWFRIEIECISRMATSPTIRHQDISIKLILYNDNYFHFTTMFNWPPREPFRSANGPVYFDSMYFLSHWWVHRRTENDRWLRNGMQFTFPAYRPSISLMTTLIVQSFSCWLFGISLDTGWRFPFYIPISIASIRVRARVCARERSE